jgi:hypothetical protein
MTELWKEQDLSIGDEEGVKFAEPGAFAAVIALFLVDHWNPHVNGSRFAYLRMQKEMGIRLFHIAV